MTTVHLIDYVAGNVRSLANAIENLGHTVAWVRKPDDIHDAEVGGYYPVSSGFLLSLLELIPHLSLAESHSSWSRTFRPLSLPIVT